MNNNIMRDQILGIAREQFSEFVRETGIAPNRLFLGINQVRDTNLEEAFGMKVVEVATKDYVAVGYMR